MQKKLLAVAVAGALAAPAFALAQNATVNVYGRLYAEYSKVNQGNNAAGAALVEPDRAAAIAMAVSRAQPADVVLIAGKGHEDYQDVQGVKTPFSDLVHARQALAARAAQGAPA